MLDQLKLRLLQRDKNNGGAITESRNGFANNSRAIALRRKIREGIEIKAHCYPKEIRQGNCDSQWNHLANQNQSHQQEQTARWSILEKFRNKITRKRVCKP
jgi:hypothetical protein